MRKQLLVCDRCSTTAELEGGYMPTPDVDVVEGWSILKTLPGIIPLDLCPSCTARAVAHT